jgi:glycosyltransferase involved in cell wall biosynthesis
VSVVVPTRDRPDLLARTLRTVERALRGGPAEIIVVDDGSTVPVRLRGDRLTTIRHDRSRGVSAARNAGLAAARGTFVAFCDDDDLWFADKTARQLDAIGDRAWCTCDAVVVDADDRPTGSQQLDPVPLTGADLRRRNGVPGGGSGVLARTEAVRSVGGFDPRFSIFADWDLWLRLAESGEPAHVPRALVAYREHAGQMARDADAALAELALLRTEHALAAGPGRADADPFIPMWILRRSNRGDARSRLHALRAVWAELPTRERILALASSALPDEVRRRRDRRRGTRVRLDPDQRLVLRSGV